MMLFAAGFVCGMVFMVGVLLGLCVWVTADDDIDGMGPWRWPSTR